MIDPSRSGFVTLIGVQRVGYDWSSCPAVQQSLGKCAQSKGGLVRDSLRRVGNLLGVPHGEVR